MLLEQTQRKQKKPNKPKGIGTKHSRNHWKTKKKTNKPKTFQRIRKCGMRFSHLPISDSLKKCFVFLVFLVFQWFLLCCDSMPSGCFGFFGFVGFADIPTLLLRAFDNPCSESNSTRLCRHPTPGGISFFFCWFWFARWFCMLFNDGHFWVGGVPRFCDSGLCKKCYCGVCVCACVCLKV